MYNDSLKNISIKLNGRNIITQSNILVSKLLKQNNSFLDLPCGENGKCGKCKVKISGEISDITDEEKELLTLDELLRGIRLACCTVITGEAIIENFNYSKSQIETKGASEVIIKDKLFKEYGLAIDIGTTTIVVGLYNSSGLMSTNSDKNPQTKVASDVISRIDKAMCGDGPFLKELVLNSINELIQGLCNKHNIGTKKIDYAVITGNTTMLYLLTGRDPVSLSRFPFEADYKFNAKFTSKEVGINISNDATVYFPLCISSFVGADITTAILASNMLNTSMTSILVDIGTNGEMALWHNNRIICCSTAAGPAFEGSEISCGCMGVDGAIDKIYLNGTRIEFTTIGNVTEFGICGSGIIDAISILKELSIIDETGAFDEGILKQSGMYINVNGQISCKISDNVYITQRDIRKVQLAKSAICSGIKTLIYLENVSTDDVDNIYIAGGFGNYLNIKSATNIGLIPYELKSKVKFIGNAALKGAAMMLFNKKSADNINEKVKMSKAIDLSREEIFMEYYIDEMKI